MAPRPPRARRGVALLSLLAGAALALSPRCLDDLRVLQLDGTRVLVHRECLGNCVRAPVAYEVTVRARPQRAGRYFLPARTHPLHRVLAGCDWQGVEPHTATGVPELLAQRWFVAADEVPPTLAVVDAALCEENSAVHVVRTATKDGAVVPAAERQVERASWFGVANAEEL
jgi:hypothetical protein